MCWAVRAPIAPWVRDTSLQWSRVAQRTFRVRRLSDQCNCLGLSTSNRLASSIFRFGSGLNLNVVIYSQSLSRVHFWRLEGRLSESALHHFCEHTQSGSFPLSESETWLSGGFSTVFGSSTSIAWHCPETMWWKRIECCLFLSRVLRA
jgi:hypothetical protein